MSKEETLKSKLEEAIDKARRKKQAIAERNEILEGLRNAENAFSNLHGNYEQVKGIMANGKSNEKVFEKRDRIVKRMVESRKQKVMDFKEATSRLIEKMNMDFMVKLNSLHDENEKVVEGLRQTEIQGADLQIMMAQSQKENDELNKRAYQLIGTIGSVGDKVDKDADQTENE